ncbi:hypothetical protein ACH5RR_026318 [Cinchona calisaya]|uniref:Uncharacterized protein n=1 Tax=Cinchona calisaya TaxID=153742 RepID=A0ABD2Z2H3_9GENT
MRVSKLGRVHRLSSQIGKSVQPINRENKSCLSKVVNQVSISRESFFHSFRYTLVIRQQQASPSLAQTREAQPLLSGNLLNVRPCWCFHGLMSEMTPSTAKSHTSKASTVRLRCNVLRLPLEKGLTHARDMQKHDEATRTCLNMMEAILLKWKEGKREKRLQRKAGRWSILVKEEEEEDVFGGGNGGGLGEGIERHSRRGGGREKEGEMGEDSNRLEEEMGEKVARFLGR